MDNISNDKIDKLVDIIYKKVMERVRSELNLTNMEFYDYGMVVSSEDSGTIVKLPFCTTDKIPNLSGVADLINGQRVKVFYDRTDMRGAYVGVAYQKE